MPLRYLSLFLAWALVPAALAQPDLTISATAEDTGGEAGDRVTLDYTVTLAGAEEIEDIPVGFYFSTDQTLSSDDALSEREEVDAESDEPESDNEQIDIPGSLSDGDYFILVVIDDLEQVTESDETNNTVAIPFSVSGGGDGGDGGADLVVTSASAEPASADAGAEIEVDYAISNDGDEQAGESSLAFYFSTNQTLSSNDVLAKRTDIDEVDANDSSDDDEELTVPNSLDPGDYFLLVVADDRNDVTESAENNNTFAVPFTVTGGGGGGGGDADLVVTNASVEPMTADAGAEVEVSYTIANEGGEEAGESQVAFYFSTDRFLSSNDVLAEREDVDDLDADGSEDSDSDITVPNSLDPGDYFLLVVADEQNDVAESTENNNTFDVPFTVTGGGGGGDGDADLDVTSASVSPSSAEVGEDVQVSYTIANDGDEQAGSFTLAFYFSTNRSLGSSDVAAESISVDEVDAGDSEDGEVEFAVPSSLDPGDYFLLVVADDGNDVTESDESNNTFAIPFTVLMTTASEGTPDVAFRLAAPAPNPATDRVTLGYSLSEAGPVHLAVYDVLGRRVATLVEATQPAGDHVADWDASGLASGTYVLRLSAAGEVRTRQATVVR
ncbi:MAG: CARDB domain-containing protein [Rhodothermales bacterium]